MGRQLNAGPGRLRGPHGAPAARAEAHPERVDTGGEMNTEQMLKAATPRPWQRGLWGGDSAQGAANSALCRLAVNSYEAREVLIADLVTALEKVKTAIERGNIDKRENDWALALSAIDEI